MPNLNHYRALCPVRHNGKPFPAGESLLLCEADAKPLLLLGAIAPDPAADAAEAEAKAEEKAKADAAAEPAPAKKGKG